VLALALLCLDAVELVLEAIARAHAGCDLCEELESTRSRICMLQPDFVHELSDSLVARPNLAALLRICGEAPCDLRNRHAAVV
jgi:hypothetical protein